MRPPRRNGEAESISENMPETVKPVQNPPVLPPFVLNQTAKTGEQPVPSLPKNVFLQLIKNKMRLSGTAAGRWSFGIAAQEIK
jgi:hypothetical protein